MKKELLNYCSIKNKEIFNIAENFLSARQYYNIINESMQYAKINNKDSFPSLSQNKLNAFYRYITIEIERALCSKDNIDIDEASRLEYRIQSIISDYFLMNKKSFTLTEVYNKVHSGVFNNVIDEKMVEGIIDKVVAIENTENDDFPIKDIIKDGENLVIEYTVGKIPDPCKLFHTNNKSEHS